MLPGFAGSCRSSRGPPHNAAPSPISQIGAMSLCEVCDEIAADVAWLTLVRTDWTYDRLALSGVAIAHMVSEHHFTQAAL